MLVSGRVFLTSEQKKYLAAIELHDWPHKIWKGEKTGRLTRTDHLCLHGCRFIHGKFHGSERLVKGTYNTQSHGCPCFLAVKIP